MLGWLSGTGAVALGTSSLVLTNQAPHEFSGSIRGSGGVTKRGDSTWTLRGASSYTGNTTVREGTLIINGTVTTSPQVEVMNGATLSGVGHVQGVTLHTGGTLKPGTEIGSLYIHGPVSLTGGRLEIELGVLAGNSVSDQIITSQRPDLSGCLLAVYPTVVPASGDSWVIVDNMSTEPVMGTFNGLPEGAYVVGSGLVFQISYMGGTGNDVSLRRVPAPASTLEMPYFTSSGGLLLRGQGVPGGTYEVQASTNLLPGSWVFLQNLVASPSGIFYIQDVNASDYPHRFYRVRSP